MTLSKPLSANKILLQFLALLFFTLPHIVFSQPSNLKFEHFTTADGLPAQEIHAISQDAFGFLWFGTVNGLCRYDGYSFKLYKLDSTNIHPAAGISITTILEDATNNLWIGTDFDGIYRLDRSSGTVTQFSCSQDSNSISSNKIRHLYLDSHELLWIVYQDSLLDCMDIHTGIIQKYRHDSNDPTSLSSNKIAMWQYHYKWNIALTEDHDGDIWISTMDTGVNRFNRGKDNFTRFQYDPSNSASLSKHMVTQIFEDSEHNLWLCTFGGGLNLYQPDSNTFQHFRHDPDNPETVMDDSCYRIIEDNEKNLWIGTPAGLECYNLQTKKFTHFIHDPDDINSIGPDMTYPFCVDKNGWIWSKSHRGSGGINDVLNPETKKAAHFYSTRNNPQAIRLGEFNCFCQDHSGMLWFGSKYNGLNKLNIYAQSFTHFRGDLKRNIGLPSNTVDYITQFESDPDNVWVGLSPGIYIYNSKTNKFSILPQQVHDKIGDKIRIVHGIVKDKNGVIWISSYGKGLIRLEENKPSKLFTHDPNNPNSLSGCKTYRMLLDSNGNLWILIKDDGLNLFDTKTEKVTHFRHNPKDSTSLTANDGTYLYEDSEGTIWAGTQRGLNKFIPESQSFERFFADMIIKCMYEDSHHNFWIGTNSKGLIKLNRESNEAVFFTTQDGLPNRTIHSIIEDDNGYLWLATFGSLCRFNPELNEFVNFYKEHGSPNLNHGAEDALKRPNGEIWLGTRYDGIIAFNPKEIKRNTIPPKITITDIRLFDESLPVGANSPLKEDLSVAKEIHFKHWQNDISIEMTALHYGHPQRNQYQHWLENYDDDWRDNATNRLVSYTNLDPGDYIFHAKGANSDGFWNEVPLSLRIIIHPPWWATVWAYLFYGLAFVAVIIGAWRFQLRRIQIRNELERKDFEARKLKELDTMKSRFFANISHEFRTPITLILGPLEKWAAKMSDQEVQRDISLMQRNIQRLHRLINQLLDLSTLEAGKMELHATTEDLVRLVNHYVQSFESQAKLNEIQLSFESNEPELFAAVDREKIENIIYNLLSNALKFTPNKGKITVSVNSISRLNSQANSKAHVEIKVSDTGIGIPEDRLHQIFNRFYQVDDSYVREHEGSGIGLSLTKELVELHSGDIRVNSAPGVGSVFTVRLPVGNVDLPATVAASVDDVSPKNASLPESALKYPEPTTEKDNPLVLIVEDNADLRTYIADVLYPNYQLIEAGNVAEGLARAIEHVPDLILSDVMMPQMDGFQLCAKLKTNEITSHIPVILLTARATRESKLEGLETGADDYLIKPFDACELEVRIKNLITQRRKLHERFSTNLLIEPRHISVTSTDERFLRRALEILEAHLADPEFDTEKFARKMGVSRSQLHRKFRALTGQSTTEFIRSIRLKRAASLIKQGYGNISEIAFEVGFNHLSYFTECFRKQFGVPPSKFIN